MPIIGVKLYTHGRREGVFSFETNALMDGKPLGLYFGGCADEMLLQISTFTKPAHKLEIMRRFQTPEASGWSPTMKPISRLGTPRKASATKTIRVTNEALDCVGQYLYYGEPLSDDSVHVDTLDGDCYNLVPSDYQVVY